MIVDPLDRPAEWALYQPLVGKRMLELGNKKNGAIVYKAVFTELGFQHTSVDLNDEDGAIPLDLRQPLGLGTFDMVANMGTTEHVSEQKPVWRNIADALPVGGVFLSMTPFPGDWWWHGDWYPTPEFYKDFADLNGLVIERLYASGIEPVRNIFCRMRRVYDVPFAMPTGGLFHNFKRPLERKP